MMVAAEYRVIVHIAQKIVHPAHVPFEVKAKAALFQIPGYLGPGRGLLRNQERSVFALLVDGIQVLQELDGLQVLLAAVDIRNPLALIFPIVQVQHGGHSIHPNAVCMILVCPEQGIGDQEVFHLRPSIVIQKGSPMGMCALSRIEMLIEAGSVKAGQAEGILREMRRHPV